MENVSFTSRLHDGDDLHRLVERTGQRLLVVRLLAGACGALSCMVLWLLLAGGVDLWLPLPAAMRIAAFSLGISLVLMSLWLGLVRPVLRRESSIEVARRIEAAASAMHSRLITVLDLQGETTADGGASLPAFEALLIAQTRQRLATFQPSQVAGVRPALRAACLLTAILTATGLALLAFPDRLSNSFARILRPTADIAPLTHITFRADPGDFSAMQGQPVTLTAIVERGAPDELELELRTASAQARPHRLPMKRQIDGRFSFTLSALDQSYDYRIIGGNTWSPLHHLRMIERPVLESIQAAIEFPDYMGINAPIAVEDPARIVAPTGSTIRFTVMTRGDVASARVRQFRHTSVATPRFADSLSLWFDDQLPGDAQMFGDWEWLEKPVAFGLKSQAFASTGRMIGFRSRLSPLLLHAGESFIFHACLDANHPPRRITVSLSDESRRIDLTWGEAAVPGARQTDPATTRASHVGSLPDVRKASSNTDAPSVDWTRFEVPSEVISDALASYPAKITGMAIEIDGGRIVLDGVGKRTRETPSPVAAHNEVDDLSSMVCDERGRWNGAVKVSTDGLIHIQLSNSNGHANAAMVPLSLVARPDEPPSVLIEKSSRAVTLDGVKPVSIGARIQDDFGLGWVGVQSSRDPELFVAAPRRIRTFAPTVTSHELVTTIEPVDANDARLKPGEALYVRVVATDRKGQLTASEPMRFAFMNETMLPDSTPSHRAVELARMIEQWQKAGENQGNTDELLRRLLATLPEIPRADRTRDDRARTAGEAEMNRRLQAWHATLSEAQWQSLREIDAQLAQARQVAAKLAGMLESQARQTQNAERQVLLELAADARALAEEAVDSSPGDRAMLERLRAARAHAARRNEDMAQLLRHMKALRQIRDRDAADPKGEARSLEDLLAQLHAADATEALSLLAAVLREKQRELAALHDRQQSLARVEPGDTKELENAEKAQRALDDAAIEAMARSRDLLHDQPQRKELAPKWSGDAKSPQALSNHQERRERELAEAGHEVSDAREQAIQMAHSLRQASMQLQTEADRFTQAGDALRSLLTSATVKAMVNMAGRARSQGEDVRSQLTGRQSDPANPGLARGEQESPTIRRGEVGPARSLERIDPDLAPALYRLPPHLRDALLQGMNDKGPVPYQRLIDSYHRQLTESVRREGR